MKNGQVIKDIAGSTVEEEMALINSYTRRELGADEVYLFTVVLCDNNIDRDHERFTVESLFELEKLFVGKTGIIDHDPTAKNQKARIISCKVESVDGATTDLGDALFRLTARAYIRRTEGNAELIEAIEAGIVKEVSVGCSISHTLCSICRNDMNTPMCSHIKGREYDGELCYGELTEPTDAYEFSFVAVPAQRAAGVIKSGYKEKNMNDILKSLESGQELTLSKGDITTLREYIGSLEQDAAYLKAYRDELCDSLKKGMKARGIDLEYQTSKSIMDKLTVTEMKALIHAFGERSPRQAVPQLCCGSSEEISGNTEFKI